MVYDSNMTLLLMSYHQMLDELIGVCMKVLDESINP